MGGPLARPGWSYPQHKGVFSHIISELGTDSVSPRGETADGAGAVTLRAVGLTKHFPVRGLRGKNHVVHAVDDVDLELVAGTVVALVGESGSGKSTVARLLAQVLTKTAGRIELFGIDTTATRGRAFREWVHIVQMILQDPFASLNPLHTVRYILSRAVTIHSPALRGKQREMAVGKLLERVQLTPPERFIDKYPHELSGGQRQRVSIARGLAAAPKALLADEPISMLDVSIRLGILNLLRTLRNDLGIAILYITHDVASARYFADRIIVMYAGRVVERGSAEEVTQAPAHPYTRLLVSSAPDPDRLADTHRVRSRGEPPSMIDPPAGCRFHPRCPYANDLCRTQLPPFTEVAPGHESACWLHSQADGAPSVAQIEEVSP